VDRPKGAAHGKSRSIVRLRVRYHWCCALVAVGFACASPGAPPGGPVDTQPPRLVDVAPDSAATSVTPDEVVFRFDEVVSERPAGAPSIGALVLISPRDGDPKVDWNRQSIAVRPRRGWSANTAYTITLLPGLSDLRGNVRNKPIVTMFSTGGTIPTGRITGTVFNWAEARVLPRAFVQATPATDTSLSYVTATDSAGAFSIGQLPPGRYTLRAFSDDNNNRGLDPREAWDTLSLQVAETATAELLTFVHDSVGSRLQAVTVMDSVTIELVFDNPLSVTTPLGAANVRVRAPDSTDVPITSVTALPPDTLLRGVQRPSRPAPPRRIIVKLGRQLRPRSDYRVIVSEVRNLIGIARSSDRTLTVPATVDPAAVPVVPPSPAGPIRR